jgi:hypothetical protein
MTTTRTVEHNQLKLQTSYKMVFSHTTQCLVKQCRYQCIITAWCTQRSSTHGLQRLILTSFLLWKTGMPAANQRIRCSSLSFETLDSILVSLCFFHSSLLAQSIASPARLLACLIPHSPSFPVDDRALDVMYTHKIDSEMSTPSCRKMMYSQLELITLIPNSEECLYHVPDTYAALLYITYPALFRTSDCACA